MLVGVLDTQLHNGQVLPFLRVDQADFFASLILQPGKQQFLVLHLSVQSDPGRHPVPHRVVPFDQCTAGGRQILRRIQQPVLAVCQATVFKADHLKASLFSGDHQSKHILLRHIDGHYFLPFVQITNGLDPVPQLGSLFKFHGRTARLHTGSQFLHCLGAAAL